jgi:hypothetical protein
MDEKHRKELGRIAEELFKEGLITEEAARRAGARLYARYSKTQSRKDLYCILPGTGNPLGQNHYVPDVIIDETPHGHAGCSCDHEWVNVGFTSLTMACMMCGMDMPSGG